MARQGSREGVVYMLGNPNLRENLWKIGCSTVSGYTRARVLQEKEGVPPGYYVAFEIQVRDARRYESAVHRALKQYRINPHKEFFLLEKSAAIALIEEAVKMESGGSP